MKKLICIKSVLLAAVTNNCSTKGFSHPHRSLFGPEAPGDDANPFFQ